MLKTENDGSKLNKMLTGAIHITFFSGTEFGLKNFYPVAASSYMG
jgi:hypothetical protein